MIRIAMIAPLSKGDYLVDTVLDGLTDLRQKGGYGGEQVSFFVSPGAKVASELQMHVLGHEAFVSFAKDAHIVLLAYGKDDTTNLSLANEINAWHKTFYIDGSEPGRDRRSDQSVMEAIRNGTYDKGGKVDKKMQEACAAYFRRERPYPDAVIPLPFGIDRNAQNFRAQREKDIDIFCVFGRYDEYLPFRREVKEEVIGFAKEHGLSVCTEMTDTPEEFNNLLARSKVGVSVAGGGYDTRRFWEVLGNNCILLTETVDIFRPEDNALAYGRVREFADIESFRAQLGSLAAYLEEEYEGSDFGPEYQDVLGVHSSRARATSVLDEADRLGLLTDGGGAQDKEGGLIRCHVCDSETGYLLDKKEYKMYLCSTCDLIFPHPLPADDFLSGEVYGEKSDYQTGKSKDLSTHEIKKKYRQSLSRMLVLSPGKGQLLDIGCSNGELIYHAQIEGFGVSGVELNPRTGAMAKENGLDVHIGTLESAGYVNGRFDVVNMGDVIEHVTDPRALLGEAVRVTNAGGLLFITTPNMGSLWARITLWLYKAFNIPPSSLSPPHHLHNFNKRNLSLLAEEEGLTEVTEFYDTLPSLKYELGLTHLWGTWRRGRSLVSLVRLLSGFGVYTLLYAFVRVLESASKNCFNMTKVYRK